jgi:hypothetical protein
MIRMWVTIVLFASTALGADSAARLSWGPYEFLEKGFRNAPWVNDPFYPETRSYEVMGIVSDEMAFINDRWFRVGEKIDGYVVKSVRPEGVTLGRRDELMFLKLR